MIEENKNDDPFSDFGQSYDDFKLAEQKILSEKDRNLKEFKRLVSEHVDNKLSYNSEYLVLLEKLYYRTYLDKEIEEKVYRTEFEDFLSIIFMQILVEKNIAIWKVIKNPFSVDKFCLAIEFEEENWSTGGFATELYENENNSGREHLVKQLEKYFNEQKHA